jgi:N-acetylmuramoyl-L-alanine amidase
MDVGAAGGGLREFELTLDVAQRVRRLLEAQGVKVALSRTGNDPVSAWTATDSTEQTRQEQEARIRAVGRVRVYVSIHFNAFSSPSLAGTETYYNSENAGTSSRRLAGGLQAGVVRRLTEAGYSPPDRGVKEDLAAGKPYGHFFSLRGGMPSALVESLFLSNPNEAALLAKDATREAIARGIADGVLAYLGR